jgi:hypothetical protein
MNRFVVLAERPRILIVDDERININLKTAVSRYRLHDLQAIGGWVADRYRRESA